MPVEVLHLVSEWQMLLLGNYDVHMMNGMRRWQYPFMLQAP